MSGAPRVHAIGALPRVGPAAVCMGAFDGVHRGHVALARVTARAAGEHGAQSVALVFDPHPDEVVRPGTVVPRLAPLAENLRRLAEAGIQHPLVVRFDASLRALEPEAFLAAMAPALSLRALIMTPESAFGRNRAGTPAAMRELGPRAGFDLVLADDILQDGGAPISSARIRALLQEGDLGEVVRLLGHPLQLEGTAVAADGAHALLRFDYPAALPAPGRYPAIVRPGGSGVPVRAELQVAADGHALLAGGPQAGAVTLELNAD